MVTKAKYLMSTFIFALMQMPLLRAIPTGCRGLDKFLGGGIKSGEVVLVYGEAEVGKTTFAVQCTVNCCRMGHKAMFIDADGTFSTKRLAQIASSDIEDVAERILLVKPNDFEEQALAIDQLEDYLTEKIGLIVLDTVTSLYRAELGQTSRQTFRLNRELNRQLGRLAQIAKARKVPVLMTGQVHTFFGQNTIILEPVATRVLKFWADTVIALKHTMKHGFIKLLVEKTPRKRPFQCYIEISKEGLIERTL
jgi:RecA/RadA recombinase